MSRIDQLKLANELIDAVHDALAAGVQHLDAEGRVLRTRADVLKAMLRGPVTPIYPPGVGPPVRRSIERGIAAGKAHAKRYPNEYAVALDFCAAALDRCGVDVQLGAALALLGVSSEAPPLPEPR